MGACDLVCVPRWGSRVSAKYLDGMTHSVDLKGVPLMRCLRCLVMIGLNLVGFSDGQAASSIDPTNPPQGVLFNPGLIQHTLQNAVNDIPAFRKTNAGSSAPSLDTLWMNTPPSATAYTQN